jgi:8-oxo-dGTP pyrophosphatase MutT (NUDIX family)
MADLTAVATAHPRPAATIALLRDAPGLEVLLVKRASALTFGPSACVFPGGKVAAADSAPVWEALAAGFDAPDRALRVAALREAFEETGILLARTAAGDWPSSDLCARLAERRGEVERDPEAFSDVVASAGLRLALDRLTPFAHWITPAFEPKRFDTRFYLAAAPAGQTARHDGGEAVDHFWLPPAAALDLRSRGEVRLMFPTRLNLGVLGRSGSAAAAIGEAAGRAVVTVEPQLVERDGRRWLRIPEAAGYDLVEEALDQVMA